MPVSDERITFRAEPANIGALVATPSGPPPWPALIVIHPVTGLEATIEQRTRDFARAGYLAVAPDIYTNDTGYR